MKIDLTHVQPFLDENLKSNLESSEAWDDGCYKVTVKGKYHECN